MEFNAIGTLENSIVNKLDNYNAILKNDTVKASDATPNYLNISEGMSSVLSSVNALQADSSNRVTAVELGQSDDLIGATIANQKASLSFDMLMQVRNKMVSNFNDIFKMPV
ncbi:flagellar hook-basal body complex protein FliE [Vibrio sp. S17_S38]|uniref:flagellar hook-basal body complex protein FliE n=1 Tax=Vibrio sp. S17_S38 TaxID=2720229 RepID=UPI0016804EFE|nr:flagellar hook-basal body complex protein FliE [Vibrio sp. S17_S38]MBD1573428.1 flagellar hook-basal body complex protein FliE [Vibrio sp. S17_S38]